MVTNVPPIPFTKTKVVVPYQETYLKPDRCVACGASPTHSTAKMAALKNPTTNKLIFFRLPLCRKCKTANSFGMFSWWTFLPTLIISIIGLWYAFTVNFIGGWLFIIFWIIIINVIRSATTRNQSKNPNSRLSILLRAVRAQLEDSTHVAFHFTDPEFARQFSALNNGVIS
jgi:hypothetical protein